MEDTPENRNSEEELKGLDQNIVSLVQSKVGPKGIEFILKYAPDLAGDRTVLIDTTARFNILKQPYSDYREIINLAHVNQIRRLNKFFLAANLKLKDGGIFIGRGETIKERRRRAYKKSFRPVTDIYYFLDFLFHRVSSKIVGLKNIYFFVTKGRRRVLSRAEILGRLCSCGFEVIEETEIDNILYFAMKKKEQGNPTINPSYGPVFRMNRVGKNGKMIGVYKMRTMHPYSEYLQEYIYKVNSLQEGGKFADDFRISTLGKLFRKFWIDELPMLYNLLNGDMKLIGVRPLSKHYLSLYDEDLKEMRLKSKPGLVPPFYADMPKTLEEIQDSERRYLQAYFKSPFFTDIKYFFKSFYNIVIKRARSQ